MPLSIVKGPASRVETSLAISVRAASMINSVSTGEHINLVIGGTPVHFAAESVPAVNEGDIVAAVGELKNGTMNALALRNFNSDVIYYQRALSYPKQALVMAIVLVVAGLATLGALGIGIIPLVFSAFMFRASKKYQLAWTMIAMA